MQVFFLILPILLVAAAGYLAARLGIFSPRSTAIISKLVFNILIPAVLFLSAAKAQIPLGQVWAFLGGYYGPALAVYALGMLLSSRLFGASHPEQSVFGMSTSYSNLTIVGIPVCTQALGEASLVPLFLIIAIHNLTMFAVGTIAAERGGVDSHSLSRAIPRLIMRFVAQPITGSLILGGLFNLLDLPLPGPVNDILSLLAKAAAPAALFVLGMTLCNFRIKGSAPPLVSIIVLKLLLFPALVGLVMFGLLSIDPLWAATAVVTAAMPVGIATYIFAERYQACQATVASAILISTLLSALSLPIVIGLIT